MEKQMRWMVGIGMALMAISFTGNVEAAPAQVSADDAPAVNEGEGDRAARKEARRARIHKKIKAAHAALVGSALELTAEQGAEVYPALGKLQDARQAAHEEVSGFVFLCQTFHVRETQRQRPLQGTPARVLAP